MFRVVYGDSANEVWTKAAKALAEHQSTKNKQASRAGDTYELLHVAISISNPRQRWVTSRLIPLNPAFSIAEVIWIMNGRNDSAFLNFFNGKLPKYAGDGDKYYGAYGHRLRKSLGIDQLQQAYETLNKNADSRQVVLQIWDSRCDLPKHQGRPNDKDIPCNLISMLKIRENKLEWTQIIRSNDIFLGLPYNLVQFTTLQEIIAGWLGVDLGSYNQLSDSLHVYEEQIDNIAKTKEGELHYQNTDIIQTRYDKSEITFLELANRVERMISDDLTNDELKRLLCLPDEEIWAQNMLCVLCAETARRKTWTDTIELCTQKCSNPVLLYMWEQWAKRVG